MPKRKQAGNGATDAKRDAANSLENSTLSVNERILKAVHELYIQPEHGLEGMAKTLELKEIIAPRKKITVLIMGNHSSGKSSFINWYVGETIQKTSVAMETTGFTLISSGKKRETLKGAASLYYWPRLQELHRRPALKPCIEYLQTEITVGAERHFREIVFIDTPGLVDGSTSYPYPVEEMIYFLAEQADLILVFFDPMGQALCKRTMNCVETLNKQSGDKIKFFLSKADELSNPHDRQKVIIQITQNLTATLRNVNFDLPTIYIPTEGRETSKVPNAITELCHEFDKTINQNVQTALTALERDCTRVTARITEVLAAEVHTQRTNAARRNRAACCAVLGFVLWPLLALLTLAQALVNRALVDDPLHLSAAIDQLDRTTRFYVACALLLLTLLCVLVAQTSWRRRQRTRSKSEISQLKAMHEHVTEHVLQTKQELYAQFFKQLSHEDD